MVLKYRTQDIVPTKTKVVQHEEKSIQIEPAETKPVSKKRFVLLLLAILLVLNIVYNVSVAKKGTPFLKSVTTNSVFDLWGTAKKIPILQKLTNKNYGVVTGIFYSDDNPIAVVSGEIVREGTVISNMKVARIYKDKVEFEKDGHSWKQRVMEKPQ
ncbi:MAG: hypothetical protein ACYSSI_07700 [Planctomycetota bacterium]|jgi:hypothetical protein